jgi:3-hydroxymyristoyl/3-hydroxydecanoyl-(acyl carrier protein) dehydratase
LSRVLADIDGVQDGVIAAPEGDDGTEVRRLVAVVVAPSLSQDAIRRAFLRSVDPAFVPRRIILVDSLPRNETGKLPMDKVWAIVNQVEKRAGMSELRTLTVDRAHPSLPGHFPGNLIVPGAIIVDHAISEVERTFGRRVTAIAIAKFLAPVRPQQPIVFSYVMGKDDQLSLVASAGGIKVFSATVVLERNANRGLD